MLRVQLGCKRRFNIEFYGEDLHFCHYAYVTWSRVELWSARVPARLSRPAGRPDHDQQRNHHAPKVEPEAATAVVAPDVGREDARNMLSCI